MDKKQKEWLHSAPGDFGFQGPGVKNPPQKTFVADHQRARGEASVRKRRGKDDDDDIMIRMRKRYESCVKYEELNRKRSADDKLFHAGDQWDASVLQQRRIDERPALTINRIPKVVDFIVNDQRQNRPGINISPNSSRTDKKAADIFSGWIRGIERDSNAESAYDWGFRDAVICGVGYWRIVAEYVADDSFDQVPRIKKVANCFSVYLDPMHNDENGADANFAFVTQQLLREDFERMYPDADPTPFSHDTNSGEGKNLWGDEKKVMVAEYFERVFSKRTLHMFSEGGTAFEDEFDEDVRGRIDTGELTIEATREVEVATIRHYKVTGREILERTDWPGKFIPIVKVVGTELDVRGDRVQWGVVRHAKDPLRMYNYWETSLAEALGSLPRTPFLVASGVIDGYKESWELANRRNMPYLIYNARDEMGELPPPIKLPPGSIPEGVFRAKMSSAEDLQAVTGVRFDATRQERTYDESGKALNALQGLGELSNFHYVDNLVKALRHTGRILIDIAPHYLDTEREIHIINADQSEGEVQVSLDIDAAYMEDQGPDGSVKKLFNPRVGQYSVSVTIGPSYATKRTEAADSIMKFIKHVPQAGPVISDLVAKYSDWVGSDEIAARLARAVPAGLLEPAPADMSPEVAAVISQLKQQLQQVTGQAQELMNELNNRNADRVVAQDKVDKDFMAKVLATMEKMEENNASRVMEIVEMLGTLQSPGDKEPGEQYEQNEGGEE